MFKDRFNKMIEEKEINITKVSEETGIPRTTMYDWAHGRTQPSLRYIKILSEFFDVSPSYFIE